MGGTVAKPRQTPAGTWEISVSHPSLPKGRKWFTFDTEEDAEKYVEQWRAMKQAGLQPPQKLMRQETTTTRTLGFIVRAWASSGKAAPSQQSALNSLFKEVGMIRLADASYTWLTGYILQVLKIEKNLSPNSIRQRVQALGKSIDVFLRHNPDVKLQNPVRLLEEEYSTYTEEEAALVIAAGKQPKIDVERDRRLHPGEEKDIVRVLSGHERDDRQRALQLVGGNALLTMFLIIVNSGLRLREAYLLRRGWMKMDAKVIVVQSSKQRRGRIKFRRIPMRKEVHAALETYLSTRNIADDAYLFPFMEEEKGLTLKKVTQRLSDRFRIAFEYAGITDLHEHDLRHEATCRWLDLRDATGNWMFRIEEINKIMGWAANSTMAQRYASYRAEDLTQRLWG